MHIKHAILLKISIRTIYMWTRIKNTIIVLSIIAAAYAIPITGMYIKPTSPFMILSYDWNA